MSLSLSLKVNDCEWKMTVITGGSAVLTKPLDLNKLVTFLCNYGLVEEC